MNQPQESGERCHVCGESLAFSPEWRSLAAQRDKAIAERDELVEAVELTAALNENAVAGNPLAKAAISKARSALDSIQEADSPQEGEGR